ncbi:Cyclin-B1-1 [Linnemannia gamsii]|uniref:Cyclin-B1-1 n=1 Tax=Linnemannia gamsii TaxID=64522 RepID=A0ABQ7JNT4_9FUNG|nr:Cyclin-B1-1 [Linnemannia gamsii]
MAINSRSQSHSASLEHHPRQPLGVLDSSLSHDPSSSTQQDPNQEVNTPQPGTFDSNLSSNLEKHPVFKGGEDDLMESGSNKRPKSGLRGVEGSNDGNNEGNNDNNDNNNDDNSSDDLPMAPPASKSPPAFKVWADNERTPIKKTSHRRAPLTDISLSIGTPTMPAVFFNTKQLGPLMTRQPKKAISRSRLVVISPFPQCQHYWDEYANDTFNYLLEIENRYDRFLYFDEHSEFGDYRATLVQWIIELCYGWFKLPNGTLQAAGETTHLNILDRFLAVVKPETIHRDKLQCVGMCTLMIAGKLEEPTGTLGTYNLCQLCDLYSTRELANMEINILKALKFEILVASATGFSDYIQRAIMDHEETRQLIDIAAAAVWISLCAVGLDWNEDLAILTGYSRNDLSPCSIVFSDMVFSTSNPLDLRQTLSFRYPVDQIMNTLRTVLAR